MYVSVFQPFAQQNSKMFHRSVVRALKDALLTTISEIESLKDENKSLKTQVGRLRSSQVKVSQLQQDLKEKEEALQNARKTARVETLDMLARTSEQWRSRCDALEESLASTTSQLQVRCLTSSLYLTAVTWWILTAGSELSYVTDILFSLFSSGAHLQHKSPGGGDENNWGERKKDKKRRNLRRVRGRKTGVKNHNFNTEEPDQWVDSGETSAHPP